MSNMLLKTRTDFIKFFEIIKCENIIENFLENKEKISSLELKEKLSRAEILELDANDIEVEDKVIKIIKNYTNDPVKLLLLFLNLITNEKWVRVKWENTNLEQIVKQSSIKLVDQLH